jgi:ubiquinone/menaquinone biosynthesis C-methylase UbiE
VGLPLTPNKNRYSLSLGHVIRLNGTQLAQQTSVDISMVHSKSNTGDYVLGHSDRELERLRLQAQLINPITRQFLIEAGLGPGMTVLDIGSGAGDVAFLAADLVGNSGKVVGIERSNSALLRARSRAEQQSLGNVKFLERDLSAPGLDQKFDAAIGRYVLCFQPDPVAVLRSIGKLVHPGGVIMFHEPDRHQMHSYPPSPLYDQACRWVGETYTRSGVDIRTGIKLYSIFQAAGLAAPTMRMHAIIGGANAVEELHLDTDQAVVLADDIVRLGIATATQLGAETLVERITEEMIKNQSVIIGRGEIGAWCRV